MIRSPRPSSRSSVALLAGPLTAYTRLLDDLDSGKAAPENLLGAIIDLTADSRDLATIFDRDPAALAVIGEQLPRPPNEMTAQTIAALTGPAPDSAALAAAKAATLAALDLGGGTWPRLTALRSSPPPCESLKQ